MDRDVVIVGMGPVGATLALLLAREDLDVLVVDAAHQTPPFMAQGLNQGLRDAGSLSWRIAQMLVGDRWTPQEPDILLADAIGVTFVTFGKSSDRRVLELVDVTGIALVWILAYGVSAVLIRPDHIVFGTTMDAGSAQLLLSRLGLALGISISNDCNDVRKSPHGLYG